MIISFVLLGAIAPVVVYACYIMCPSKAELEEISEFQAVLSELNAEEDLHRATVKAAADKVIGEDAPEHLVQARARHAAAKKIVVEWPAKPTAPVFKRW